MNKNERQKKKNVTIGDISNMNVVQSTNGRGGWCEMDEMKYSTTAGSRYNTIFRKVQKIQFPGI